jgi:hypothetical protein
LRIVERTHEGRQIRARQWREPPKRASALPKARSPVNLAKVYAVNLRTILRLGA